LGRAITPTSNTAHTEGEYGLLRELGGNQWTISHPLVQQFCGGLASGFPNTASVESDFSAINWEKIKIDKTSQISGLKASCIANRINI
jgi:hypothetical protein